MNTILNHKILGEGQPLVILHGLFGSLDNWMTLAKQFAHGYKVVLVDQRNHGKSFHNSGFDYTLMAEDLENLINHLELQDPILLGHSMGGKTVMQYAAFHPEKIDKLIVADIGPKQYPVHHDVIIKALKNVNFDLVSKREGVDEILAQSIKEIGTRSFLMKNIKRDKEGKLAWKMNLNTISENITEVGRSLDYYLPIEMPTLFIRGGNSDYIRDADFETISEIFPEAKFDTVEGAGHWLHADSPHDFYQTVIKFIS